MAGRLRAAGQLALHGLLPVDATRVTAAGEQEVVAAAQLQTGDVIVLTIGQQIPADAFPIGDLILSSVDG